MLAYSLINLVQETANRARKMRSSKTLSNRVTTGPIPNSAFIADMSRQQKFRPTEREAGKEGKGKERKGKDFLILCNPNVPHSSEYVHRSINHPFRGLRASLIIWLLPGSQCELPSMIKILLSRSHSIIDPCPLVSASPLSRPPFPSPQSLVSGSRTLDCDFGVSLAFSRRYSEPGNTSEE